MSTARPRDSQGDDTLNLVADLPLIFMAIGVTVLMLGIFAQRVGHPFDLEWMEGGMLLHGYRVQTGQALYVVPSSDFIPFIYTPLYAWVLGIGGKLFGLSYGLGRSISVLGSLAGAAALIAAVRGEKGSTAIGLGAAALFLTTWDESGTFMDLVRTDGLLIGLLSWAFVAIRHGWIRSGGVLLVLAFMAKHAVAIFGLPGILWIAWRWGWPGARRFLCWCLLPALAFVEWMVLEGDGLFLSYILEAPSTHPFVYERFYPGTPLELYESLPWTNRAVGLSCILGLLGLIFRRGPESLAPGLYWGSQAVLVIVMCMVMRGHHGGYLNVLMPGHWMLAALAGISLASVQRWFPFLLVRVGVTVLICAQLWEGSQWVKGGNPVSVDAWLPTKGDLVGGEAVVEAVAKIPGQVLAPWYPWIPVKAGKRPYFHLIALWDIMHKESPLRPYGSSVRADLKAQRWQAILGISPSKSLRYGVEESYWSVARLPREQRFSIGIPKEAGAGAMRTRTGWPVRPQLVMVPKIRDWTLELPRPIRDGFDMQEIRRSLQGVWRVQPSSGPDQIYHLQKKKLTVYAANQQGKVVKKRSSRFSVLAPCAFGTATARDGNLPEWKIQGFRAVDSDVLKVGPGGSASGVDLQLDCRGERLFLESNQGCSNWSGSSDHLKGAFVYLPDEERPCVLESAAKARSTWVRQESLAVAKEELLGLRER
jgi:hypothetical protein